MAGHSNRLVELHEAGLHSSIDLGPKRDPTPSGGFREVRKPAGSQATKPELRPCVECKLEPCWAHTLALAKLFSSASSWSKSTVPTVGPFQGLFWGGLGAHVAKLLADGQRFKDTHLSKTSNTLATEKLLQPF